MVSGFFRSTFWALIFTINSICLLVMIIWMTTFEWNLESLRTASKTTQAFAHKIGMNVMKLNQQTIEHSPFKIYSDPEIVFYHDPISGNIYASVRKQKTQINP